ncbi:ribosomal protein S18-alanine N-acetyltransferase [Inmirania thermothiophila]|uniref:[Ribosomal protein bS18]-alanine N-acetyltransferase n=1 Tax=Inmirania thermothiophila TaxID=1750597 RepID=A0A3N1Y8F4_9GAMM|nr:ribosomal protein S18-alanine N-acetyltransferase [Inmirania thermothiophila]ROR35094.1 [SSU ribosomal protein S18P]-alanine acetyltransferase [Inmirania thermothiophila]
MNAVARRLAALRPLRAADLPAVIAIERAAYAFPWSEGIFRDCLRAGYPGWVYEEGGEIRGYGLMSVTVGECHILNLCVRPQDQGRGIGRLILEHLIDQARRAGADSAFLEVRPSNRVAIRLYRDLGFDTVGVRRDYYPAADGREDALIMARAL